MSNEDKALGQHLPIDKVHPSPTNPRKRFDAEMLQEMADSIRQHGVMQPILVRKHPSIEDEYEIVSGECRYRGSIVAEVETIPAVIRELSDIDAMKLQVIENLQRNDLHPLEEAQGFKSLMETAGITAEELADTVGKSRTFVYDSLKLLDLPEPAKDAFFEGNMNRSTAILITRLEEDDAKAAVQQITTSEAPLSYREAKEVVDNVIRTSGQRKEAAELMEKARALVAEYEAQGKTVVFLDTEEKRNEWARWGFYSLTYNSKPGYTIDSATVVPKHGYRAISIKQALTEDEYPGATYLINPQAEVAMVLLRAEAEKLVMEKVEAGKIELEPVPVSDHVKKVEAAEQEQERRKAEFSKLQLLLGSATANQLQGLLSPILRDRLYELDGEELKTIIDSHGFPIPDVEEVDEEELIADFVESVKPEEMLPLLIEATAIACVTVYWHNDWA
ncbi:MAG TPA: ParB/RepB/Spo0J family partition protein, partial [Methylophilaceae bacterium]|nr:ParB/RepB/Spo0J family partition protein [Methylophilaceae bacterium]